MVSYGWRNGQCHFVASDNTYLDCPWNSRVPLLTTSCLDLMVSNQRSLVVPFLCWLTKDVNGLKRSPMARETVSVIRNQQWRPPCCPLIRSSPHLVWTWSLCQLRSMWKGFVRSCLQCEILCQSIVVSEWTSVQTISATRDEDLRSSSTSAVRTTKSEPLQSFGWERSLEWRETRGFAMFRLCGIVQSLHSSGWEINPDGGKLVEVHYVDIAASINHCVILDERSFGYGRTCAVAVSMRR